MNSYNIDGAGDKGGGTYHEGDLLVRMNGCETDDGRDCEKEMEPYFGLWKKTVAELGGK